MIRGDFDKEVGSFEKQREPSADMPEDESCEVEGEQPDEETGASPGTAQACSDLGLNSLTANLDRFGIKPPGVS